MSFESLGLRSELLRAVSESGYTTPTPIQRQAIPLILEGRDIMGGAQTGTGKTAGFTLPLCQQIMLSIKEPQTHRAIRALIITPTRELAIQVSESVQTYAKYLPLKSTVVYGGVKINRQIQRIQNGVDILVATPGRLLDHVSQNTVNLSKVDILVLDEADRMLDMGFIRDIKKILNLLPQHKQTLLFSATFNNDIKRLANDLLKKPALIEVAKRNTASDRVTQLIYPVDKNRKRELLSYLIGSNNWQQVLVFTRTKHGANRLCSQLIQDGLKATAIHGNKSQGARSRALTEFKAGIVRVLVATDVAARGLDIDQLPHVINYELPNVPEDYVHRIGRTGRAGNEGQAISLVCVDELSYLKDIEKLINRPIPREIQEGYEPDPRIMPESEKNKPAQRQQKKPAHRGAAKQVTRGRGIQRGENKGRPNNGNRTRRQTSNKTKAR